MEHKIKTWCSITSALKNRNFEILTFRIAVYFKEQ